MPFRRPSPSLIASIIVHLVVAVFFVQALLMRQPLIDVFARRRTVQVGPVERIGFLTLPRQSTNAPPTPGKRGGDGHPILPTPPLVAPQTIPATPPKVPPTRPSSVPSTEPGTGPLIGGGGETRGVQPHYNDPRLWGHPDAIATAPKSSTEQLDSLIGSAVGAYNDSVRIATGSHREPGDWTVEHNGQKYGMDRKFIRLGPVSIPTAILALLPLNKVGGNPTVIDRENRLNAIHDEIFSQAQRAINDADFEKAVRNIRERKDRERAQQKAAADSAAKNH